MTSNSFNRHYLLVAIVLVFVCKSENAIDTNNPVLLVEGKTLELTCNRSENGISMITEWQWRKNGNSITDLSLEEKQRITTLANHNLQIRDAKKGDIGEWTCSDSKDPAIQNTINLFLRPWLLPFDEYSKTNYKSANVIEGERFSLRCVIQEGFTPKAFIRWFKYNESEHENPFRVLLQLGDEGPDGHIHINMSNVNDQTLTIDKVVPSDRHYYVCQSYNGVFYHNNTILLRVKDKLGALWPFLGIVAEVIILCTIIFIYEKRRIKPDFDDSDNDNATEPKSTQDRSSKSQDVRQRK